MRQFDIVTDFSSGEISERLFARSDLDVYRKSAALIENFLQSMPSGTDFRKGSSLAMVVSRSNGTSNTRFIPYYSNTDIAVVFILTDGAIHYLTSAGGSGTVMATLAFADADIPAVQFAQTNDLVVLTHRNHAPVMIPLQGDTPGTPLLLTLTEDSAIAAWNDAEPYTAKGTLAKVSATYNGKTIRAIYEVAFPGTSGATSPTFIDAWGSWKYGVVEGTTGLEWRFVCEQVPFQGTNEYPSACAFRNGRLFLGGSINRSQTIWASRPYSYTSFRYFGQVKTSSMVTVAPEPVTFVATPIGSSTSWKTLRISGSDIPTREELLPYTGKGISGTGADAACQLVVPPAYDGSTNKDVKLTKTLDTEVIDGTESFTYSVSLYSFYTVPEKKQTDTITNIITEENAFVIDIASDQNDQILAFANGPQGLVVMTNTSEWVIPDGVTALNPQAAMVARYGASYVQPKVVAGGLCYVGADGTTFNMLTNGNQILSSINPEINLEGIDEFDFSQCPYPMVYCLSGGRVNFYSMSPVNGWGRIIFPGEVKSLCVVPSANGDNMYYCARLQVGASWFDLYGIYDRGGDAPYLDLYRTMDSAGDLTNADNAVYAGQEIMAEWKVGGDWRYGPATCTGTTVTLPASAPTPSAGTPVYVGFPYVGRIKTNRAIAQGQIFPGTMKQRRLGGAILMMYQGYPTRAGRDFLNLSDVPLPTGQVAPFTGPVSAGILADWNTNPHLCIEHSDPTPLSLSAIAMEVDA